jgi:8-oxo-dGTP pyrophosphatase MutT (NUDIX family)
MGLEFDEKSCGILVLREEGGIRKYLLLHYPSGHWDFPKGHVENGENEYETASRELTEETGISDLQFFENFREPISYIYKKNRKPSNKQVVFFLGKTSTKDIKISFEHKGSLWLPYEEALKKVTFENARKVLTLAEKFLQK